MSDILAEADFGSAALPFKKHWKHHGRRNKNLKTMLAEEQKRLAALPMSDKPTYFNIDAGPSLKPQKHWCDITGMPGTYKSVRLGLRYYNKEVYGVIQTLGPGVDQQYLSLRNANVVLR